MSTLTFTTVLDMTTDAGFEAWGSEFNSSLAAVGLTQTADTGQIDWTTVTRPSSGSAGYEIWRFNDTLQSTKPIFIKLRYGCAYANVYPNWSIQVGTGSDGAGNLTGPTTTECACCTPATVIPTTAYISRFNYNAALGFLGLVWKFGAPGPTDQAMGGAMVMRSNDTSGAPTNEGVVVLSGGAAPSSYSSTSPVQQTINFTSGTVYPPSGYVSSAGTYGWCPWPAVNAGATMEGGDVSVMPCFCSMPQIEVLANICTALQGEVAMHATISLALVGSTPVTLIQVGRCMGNGQAAGNSAPPSASPGMLMLWQ